MSDMTQPKTIPPVPSDLIVMSETSHEMCADFANTLRKGADLLTQALRVPSPDFKGVRFQRIGFEMEHSIYERRYARISVNIARNDGSDEWDEAIVLLDPSGLGEYDHPHNPIGLDPYVPAKETNAEVEGLKAAVAYATSLLDIAADPDRAASNEMAGLLLKRVSGIAAMVAGEFKFDPDSEGRFDVIWPNHEGPLRVMGRPVDFEQIGMVDMIDPERRQAWSAELPPVMGVAVRGKALLLRPMGMDQSFVPEHPIDRMRMASHLKGL